MFDLPKKMYAGVMDGKIYVSDCFDSYTPVAIALFKTKAEAEKHFEKVLEIHTADLVGTGESK